MLMHTVTTYRCSVEANTYMKVMPIWFEAVKEKIINDKKHFSEIEMNCYSLVEFVVILLTEKQPRGKVQNKQFLHPNVRAASFKVHRKAYLRKRSDPKVHSVSGLGMFGDLTIHFRFRIDS